MHFGQSKEAFLERLDDIPELFRAKSAVFGQIFHLRLDWFLEGADCGQGVGVPGEDVLREKH